MWFVTIINSQGSNEHKNPYLDFLHLASLCTVVFCTSCFILAWPLRTLKTGSSSSYSALISFFYGLVGVCMNNLCVCSSRQIYIQFLGANTDICLRMYTWGRTGTALLGGSTRTLRLRTCNQASVGTVAFSCQLVLC